MPSMNLRELRNTRQLKAWLKAGQVVELRERNTILGRILPDRPAQTAPRVLPDFEARAKKNFGDQVLPGSDLLIEEREQSRY